MGIHIPLDGLEPGCSGTIRMVIRGPSYRRMLDMGLTPGTPLKVVRRAPFGDPIEILIRGFHLALRKEEASRVVVEPTEGS